MGNEAGLLGGSENTALLRLLQLASPTLPVGAYSYSEGLEYLVQAGQLSSAEGLDHWLRQELRYGAIRLEAAVMVRGMVAVLAEDSDRLHSWNDWLSAFRETEELRAQSWQMGRSLLRLLRDLHPQPDLPLDLKALQQAGCNFAMAYAIVAVHWQIAAPVAVLGYLHSWATNLIGAGIKLIPLGQTSGQQLLLNLQPVLEEAAQEILTLPDEDLSSCGWGLALASMNHETLYSRLFRS